MAQQMTAPISLADMTDSRRAALNYQSGVNAGDRALSAPAAALSIDELRAFLLAFDSDTYTERVLDIMNTNDMIFAWRMCSGNETSIADYMTPQVSRTA